jgi:hypothetical protein
MHDKEADQEVIIVRYANRGNGSRHGCIHVRKFPPATSTELLNRMAIGATTGGTRRNFRDESRFDRTRIILPLNMVGSTERRIPCRLFTAFPHSLSSLASTLLSDLAALTRLLSHSLSFALYHR